MSLASLPSTSAALVSSTVPGGRSTGSAPKFVTQIQSSPRRKLTTSSGRLEPAELLVGDQDGPKGERGSIERERGVVLLGLDLDRSARRTRPAAAGTAGPGPKPYEARRRRSTATAPGSRRDPSPCRADRTAHRVLEDIGWRGHRPRAGPVPRPGRRTSNPAGRTAPVRRRGRGARRARGPAPAAGRRSAASRARPVAHCGPAAARVRTGSRPAGESWPAEQPGRVCRRGRDRPIPESITRRSPPHASPRPASRS